jgi:hypothetical protein
MCGSSNSRPELPRVIAKPALANPLIEPPLGVQPLAFRPCYREGLSTGSNGLISAMVNRKSGGIAVVPSVPVAAFTWPSWEMLT